MRKVKLIIIGPQLTGKTTLARYLRSNTNLPIVELDEEIVRINKGVWPKDDNYKNSVLVPLITSDIKNRENVVFITSYFDPNTLEEARQNGFKVIQLELDLEKLKKRNIKRMQNEGYDDASKWFEGNLKFQNIVRRQGLVDTIINTDQLVKNIAQKVLACLEIK